MRNENSQLTSNELPAAMMALACKRNRSITPNERIAAMIAIAIVTVIVAVLDFANGTAGILAFILAPIGIGAICAVLFLGRGD